MEANDRIGGACGEIEVFEPTNRESGYGWKEVRDPEEIATLEQNHPQGLQNSNHSKCGDKWYKLTKRN